MSRLLRMMIAAQIVALAVPLASPSAHAQTAMPDPAKLEVAGVRLGMTLDEAQAALKAFDPNISFVTKAPAPNEAPQRVWDSHPGIVALSQEFSSSAFPNRDPNSDAYEKCVVPPQGSYSGGYAPRRMYNGDCQYAVNRQFTEQLTAPRAIAVWFSPLPGQGKVIAVSSSTVFIKSLPTVASVSDALLHQYGVGKEYVKDNGDNEFISLGFDARSRLMGGKNVEAIGFHDQNYDTYYHNYKEYGCFDQLSDICPAIYLPDSIRHGDGVRLVAWIAGGVRVCDGKPEVLRLSNSTQCHPDPHIAKSASLILYNSGELDDFETQVKAMSEQKKQQEDSDAEKKAGGAVPKF